MIRQPLPLLAGYLTGVLIDETITVINSTKDVKQLYPVVVAIFTIILVAAIVSKLTTVINQKLSLFMDFFLDKETMKRVATLDLAYIEDPQISNSITKISRNSARVYRLIDSFVYLIPNILVMGMSIIIFAKLSPIFLVVIFIANAPTLYEELLHGKRIWGIWDANLEVVRDYGDTSGYVRSDKSIGEVKLFGLVDYLTDRAEQIYTKFVNEQIKVENQRLKLGLFFSVISSIGNGVTFLLIAVYAIAEKITVGSIAFYVQTARSLAESVGYSLELVASIVDHSSYVKEYFEIMAVENKIVSGNKMLPQALHPPLIEFKNVSFKYPHTQKNVLENFDLKIEPGQNIAIVGKNGAGKTTLIKLLIRLYDVDEGEILINNTPVKELDLDDLYKHIATLFQQFNMYHFDAQTNIGLGKLERMNDAAKIKTAATMSGAAEFIEKYDHGYDQILNKRYTNGIEPSYGQWQKIALARAFFRDPDILILDEPTSAIDPKSEYEIFEKLFTFAEQKTVIIISHRFSTVRNAQRIIVLGEGRIIEDGSHQELMQIENGVYKTTFEIQRKGYA